MSESPITPPHDGAGASRPRTAMSRKTRIFWPLLALLVLADCTTKALAVERLSPAYEPHEVLGSMLQLTLAYNPGTAFGLDIGPWSRPLLIGITLFIVMVLLQSYRRAPAADGVRALALALVCGGAVGNLLDRLRSARGVVDFIDVGLGAHRFWTFNLADVAVTSGAVLLMLVLWRQEQSERTDTASIVA